MELLFHICCYTAYGLTTKQLISCHLRHVPLVKIPIRYFISNAIAARISMRRQTLLYFTMPPRQKTRQAK